MGLSAEFVNFIDNILCLRFINERVLFFYFHLFASKFGLSLWSGLVSVGRPNCGQLKCTSVRLTVLYANVREIKWGFTLYVYVFVCAQILMNC